MSLIALIVVLGLVLIIEVVILFLMIRIIPSTVVLSTRPLYSFEVLDEAMSPRKAKEKRGKDGPVS